MQPLESPLFVTLTGADDQTDLARMAALSSRYPIEWGILFAPARQGQGRFPSLEFVRKVLDHGPMRLSAHLCGEYAREVILHGSCAELAPLLHGKFHRAQINTAERNIERARIRRFADALAMSGAVLQCRLEFPQDPTVDWLFDASGGRGVLARSWPKAPAAGFYGYAGGLNPDTITTALPEIQEAAGAGPYWIDAESGLRTDDRFDLDKCELLLLQIYPDK